MRGVSVSAYRTSWRLGWRRSFASLPSDSRTSQTLSRRSSGLTRDSDGAATASGGAGADCASALRSSRGGADRRAGIAACDAMWHAACGGRPSRPDSSQVAAEVFQVLDLEGFRPSASAERPAFHMPSALCSERGRGDARPGAPETARYCNFRWDCVPCCQLGCSGSKAEAAGRCG